jgi:regulatory protein
MRGGPRRSRIRELSPDPSIARRQAQELCLRMLTDRARTRHQLAEVLTEEQVPADVIAVVLDRLEELRLIDDAAYAEAFVRSRARAGVARRSVSRELRSKGITDEDAEPALAAVDPAEERATAVRLARARAARTVGLPPLTRQRRLAGFLARKGYSGDVVSDVVREVLSAQDLDADNLDAEDLDAEDPSADEISLDA